MKIILVSLSALALFSGAASATGVDSQCTNLTANWVKAPHKQCGRILGNGSQTPSYKSIDVPEEEPDFEEEDLAA